jgi:acetylornithine deacetylase/succinyl-diaminopimelate desuccinylase-like protein
MMSDPIVTYLQQHLDEYVADLRLLSVIDSGTDDKAGVDAVQDWLTERMQRIGFSVERHRQERWAMIWSLVYRGRAAHGSCCLGTLTPSIPVGRPHYVRSPRLVTS